MKEVTLLLLLIFASSLNATKRDFDPCSEVNSHPPNEKLTLHGTDNSTTFGQLSAFCSKLQRTTTEMILFHWSHVGDCLRWGIQGNLQKSEMDYLCSDGRRMASGGGYYLANDTTSSAYAGPCCTVARIPTGTPIYDEALALSMLRMWLTESKVIVGRLIPFIHNYGAGTGQTGWWVTHSHIPLQNLESGPPADANDTLHPPVTLPSDYSAFIRILYGELSDDWFGRLPSDNPRTNLLRDAMGYFKSLMILTHYYDGFSLLRAAIVAPDNPWSVFDPDHFEFFRAAFEKYHTAAVNGINFGIIQGGEYLNSTQWPAMMAAKMLPQLYQELSGDSNLVIRTEPVRAGGDFNNNTFLATGAMVTEMMRNPYLSPVAVPAGTGNPDEYLVYYLYPDNSHFAKLANSSRLPPDFVQLLQSGACCSDNQTSMMVKLLELNIFSKTMGRYTFALQVPLEVALVSVHPYSDFNGRSTRFFALLTSLDNNDKPPISFISDFDLLINPRLYIILCAYSSNYYRQLWKDMFSQMLRLVFRFNKKAESHDYYSLPSWMGLIDSLSLFSPNCKSVASFSDSQLELIRTRNWIYLLDELCGGRDIWIDRVNTFTASNPNTWK